MGKEFKHFLVGIYLRSIYYILHTSSIRAAVVLYGRHSTGASCCWGHGHRVIWSSWTRKNTPRIPRDLDLGHYR